MALRTPPLEEQIEALRSKINTFIDERVVEMAKETPGVPAAILRNLLTARAGGCQCAQYLQIMKERGAA
ncbi:hypothetical protein [Bradyrhizobium icense]|uniref:Uncharacterized protein n=1 Tax=Bradyrhizobium icense TaxID=1274631 RepID=A0A1B1UHL7_9BRAD|nr:hypothetical protein [Bradyrhizobium icense]ANW02248.1 hypothetical protein LMTR13_20825 [Bradyrhizobium icense]